MCFLSLASLFIKSYYIPLLGHNKWQGEFPTQQFDTYDHLSSDQSKRQLCFFSIIVVKLDSYFAPEVAGFYPDRQMRHNSQLIFGIDFYFLAETYSPGEVSHLLQTELQDCANWKYLATSKQDLLQHANVMDQHCHVPTGIRYKCMKEEISDTI